MKFTSLHTKLALILLSTGVVCSSVIVVYAKTTTTSKGQIDLLIDQAATSTEKNDFSALTKNLSQGGNIYDMAYKVAKHQSLEGISLTFTSVAENINSQYNCSISAKDVSTVIASDAALNTSLAGLLGTTILDLDASSIVQSCVKIAQCVKGKSDAQSATELENAYTQEVYPLCRQTVSNQFTSTLPLALKQNTLDSANHGDDMFYNGTLDDSPFDLLVDMQKIGDLLFVSNTEAPQVTLYDFPASTNTQNNG